MKFNYVCCFFLYYSGYAFADESVQLAIEPSKPYVVKYVGDSAKLTCSIAKKNFTYVKENFFAREDEDDKYSLNWMIPTNAHDRVKSNDTKGRFEINISDMQESDSGNYTCHVINKLDNAKLSNFSSVYVSVLPRAQVSYCDQYSFYCRRTLCIPLRYKCDGVPDCPDGRDESEEVCGKDVCQHKLSCEDGRCLAAEFCCRTFGESPPDCALQASVRCCRQLIHPALVNQDMFFMASQHESEQGSVLRSFSSVAMGIGTPLLLIVILTSVWICRWKASPTRVGYNNNISSLDSFFRNRIIISLRGSPESSGRYLLRPVGSGFSRRELILQPIDNGDHQMGLLAQSTDRNSSQADPPPTYLQVIGAPPPPYTAETVEENEQAQGNQESQSVSETDSTK